MADSAGGREVGRISIRVTPNLKGFYRELKSKLEEVENTLKAKVGIEPDLGNFRAEVRAATSHLPDAKVKVDVDRSALDRVGESIKNLKAPKIPSIGGIPGPGVAAI